MIEGVMQIGDSWYNLSLLVRVQRIAANSFTLTFVGNIQVPGVTKAQLIDAGLGAFA